MDRILLIRTGGTIDAQGYDNLKAPPRVIVTLEEKDSLILPIIGTLPNHENVDNHIWDENGEKRFVKDSQLFTLEDIKSLAEIIKKDDQHNYFLITHGTDTMVRNAGLMEKELRESGKVVIFVGSVVPLSMRKDHKCGGVKTLRFALKNIYKQPAGVRIVGTDSETGEWRFFNPGSVYKDREKSIEKSVLVLSSL